MARLGPEATLIVFLFGLFFFILVIASIAAFVAKAGFLDEYLTEKKRGGKNLHGHIVEGPLSMQTKNFWRRLFWKLRRQP